MAVNKPYGTGPGETTIPVLTTAALQPGSTFKVFTLTAAISPGSAAVEHVVLRAGLLRLAGLPHRQAGSGRYTRGRAAATASPTPIPAEAANYDMTQATWNSVNTYYIQLEEKVGVQNVADMAIRLGIPAPAAHDGRTQQRLADHRRVRRQPARHGDRLRHPRRSRAALRAARDAVGHDPRRQGRHADPASGLPAGHPVRPSPTR